MSVVNNEYQTNLLFKQFVGVAAARLDDQFSVENFKSIPNIFSKDVMIEDIPSSAPFKISGAAGLDNSGHWIDSSSNYANNSVEESTYYNPSGSPDNGKTFAELQAIFHKNNPVVTPELENQIAAVQGNIDDKYKENIVQIDGVNYIVIGGKTYKLPDQDREQ